MEDSNTEDIRKVVKSLSSELDEIKDKVSGLSGSVLTSQDLGELIREIQLHGEQVQKHDKDLVSEIKEVINEIKKPYEKLINILLEERNEHRDENSSNSIKFNQNDINLEEVLSIVTLNEGEKSILNNVIRHSQNSGFTTYPNMIEDSTIKIKKPAICQCIKDINKKCSMDLIIREKVRKTVDGKKVMPIRLTDDVLNNSECLELLVKRIQ